MKKSLVLLFVLGLMAACQSPKTVAVYNYAPPLPPGSVVEVVGAGQVGDSKLLGTIKIGEGGMTTNCGYEKVIADAKQKAREMGGNAIFIKSHKEPDIYSSCHRIECEVYLSKK